MSQANSYESEPDSAAPESFDAGEQEVDTRSADSPSTSPVVEILPPEVAGIDPERFANMAVNRTQISLGLTGISFNRTRLSGVSGQPSDGLTSGNQAEADRAETPATVAPSSTAETSTSGSHISQSNPSQSNRSGATHPSSASASEQAAPRATTSAQSSPVGSGQAASDGADAIEPDFESVQLFSQFLVGLVNFGVDELMERIHYFDEEIKKDPAGSDLDKQIDQAEEAVETVFRYWVIGTLMWGERTALSVSYRTFQKSLDVGGYFWRIADRTTDNFLLRPVRRPFERLSAGLQKDAVARIDEGRNVERRGRVLAEQTVNDIVGDFMDYLSENPDLVDLISESGMGLAGNVMDNGRQIGAVTDTLVENMLRKVFRRPKREELPPSPFDGIPQTMYDPINQISSHEAKAEGKQ